MSVPKEWLEKINEEFRKQDIPLGKRPWLALQKYCEEYNDIFLGLGSTSNKEIFEWFENKYKLKLKSENGYYKSVYYIDSEFWEISIPIVFGSPRPVIPFDCLTNMPKAIKDEVFVNSQNAWEYSFFWADCFDYSYGYQQLLNNQTINSDGLKFFKAADQDLRKAITHLSNRIDNSSIVWDCRYATEKFMKAMIGFKVGLSETKARNINHDLKNGLEELIKVTGYMHLEELRSELDLYPAYKNERYDSIALDKITQWKCFRLAQLLGALVVREFADTNMLGQVAASANRNE